MTQHMAPARGYDLLKRACQDFVDKVNRGDARSIKSYAQMVAALDVADGRIPASKAADREREIVRRTS